MGRGHSLPHAIIAPALAALVWASASLWADVPTYFPWVPLSAGFGASVHGLSVVPASDGGAGSVYLQGDDISGLFRSEDCGETWQPVQGGPAGSTGVLGGYADEQGSWVNCDCKTASCPDVPVCHSGITYGGAPASWAGAGGDPGAVVWAAVPNQVKQLPGYAGAQQVMLRTRARYASVDGGRQNYPLSASCKALSIDHGPWAAVALDRGEPAQGRLGHAVVAAGAALLRPMLESPRPMEASGCAQPVASAGNKSDFCALRSIAWTQDLGAQLVASLQSGAQRHSAMAHLLDLASHWHYSSLAHLAVAHGSGSCNPKGPSAACVIDPKAFCHGAAPQVGKTAVEDGCPAPTDSACGCQDDAGCHYPGVIDLQIDPRTGWAYAASDVGLLVSPDGGRTWTRTGLEPQPTLAPNPGTAPPRPTALTLPAGFVQWPNDSKGLQTLLQATAPQLLVSEPPQAQAQPEPETQSEPRAANCGEQAYDLNKYPQLIERVGALSMQWSPSGTSAQGRSDGTLTVYAPVTWRQQGVLQSSVLVASLEPGQWRWIFRDTRSLRAEPGCPPRLHSLQDPQLPQPKLPISQQYGFSQCYQAQTANAHCPMQVVAVAAAPSAPHIAYALLSPRNSDLSCTDQVGGKSLQRQADCRYVAGVYQTLDEGLTWSQVLGRMDPQMPWTSDGDPLLQAHGIVVSPKNPYVAWIHGEQTMAWRLQPIGVYPPGKSAYHPEDPGPFWREQPRPSAQCGASELTCRIAAYPKLGPGGVGQLDDQGNQLFYWGNNAVNSGYRAVAGCDKTRALTDECARWAQAGATQPRCATADSCSYTTGSTVIPPYCAYHPPGSTKTVPLKAPCVDCSALASCQQSPPTTTPVRCCLGLTPMGQLAGPACDLTLGRGASGEVAYAAKAWRPPTLPEDPSATTDWNVPSLGDWLLLANADTALVAAEQQRNAWSSPLTRGPAAAGAAYEFALPSRSWLDPKQPKPHQETGFWALTRPATEYARLELVRMTIGSPTDSPQVRGRRIGGWGLNQPVGELGKPGHSPGYPGDVTAILRGPQGLPLWAQRPLYSHVRLVGDGQQSVLSPDLSDNWLFASTGGGLGVLAIDAKAAWASSPVASLDQAGIALALNDFPGAHGPVPVQDLAYAHGYLWGVVGRCFAWPGATEVEALSHVACSGQLPGLYRHTTQETSAHWQHEPWEKVRGAPAFVDPYVLTIAPIRRDATGPLADTVLVADWSAAEKQPAGERGPPGRGGVYAAQLTDLLPEHQGSVRWELWLHQDAVSAIAVDPLSSSKGPSQLLVAVSRDMNLVGGGWKDASGVVHGSRPLSTLEVQYHQSIGQSPLEASDHMPGLYRLSAAEPAKGLWLLPGDGSEGTLSVQGVEGLAVTPARLKQIALAQCRPDAMVNCAVVAGASASSAQRTGLGQTRLSISGVQPSETQWGAMVVSTFGMGSYALPPASEPQPRPDLLVRQGQAKQGRILLKNAVDPKDNWRLQSAQITLHYQYAHAGPDPARAFVVNGQPLRCADGKPCVPGAVNSALNWPQTFEIPSLALQSPDLAIEVQGAGPQLLSATVVLDYAPVLAVLQPMSQLVPLSPPVPGPTLAATWTLAGVAPDVADRAATLRIEMTTQPVLPHGGQLFVALNGVRQDPVPLRSWVRLSALGLRSGENHLQFTTDSGEIVPVSLSTVALAQGAWSPRTGVLWPLPPALGQTQAEMDKAVHFLAIDPHQALPNRPWLRVALSDPLAETTVALNGAEPQRVQSGICVEASSAGPCRQFALPLRLADLRKQNNRLLAHVIHCGGISVAPCPPQGNVAAVTLNLQVGPPGLR